MMAKKKMAAKKASKKAPKKVAKKKAARKSAKAAKSLGTNTSRPLSSARAHLGRNANGHAERHAPTLPESGVSGADIKLFRAAVESQLSQVMEELQKTQSDIADVRDQNNRLLATTAESRERAARIEVSLEETRMQLTFLAESQRQPEPAPDRERTAAQHAHRVSLARQMVALNLRRPTPAIVGRVMFDEKAFNPRSAKTPSILFHAICTSVTAAFSIPTAPPAGPATDNRDHVHLDKEMVAVLEGRSSRPRKKHSDYFDHELKKRLTLLVNQRLARSDKQEGGKNYDRYLTEEGQGVFEDWPDWTDRIGGCELADEPSIPSERNQT